MQNEKMSRIKENYAWIICAGCSILLFCTSGLAINAFAVYQPYILQLNGFTNSQSSLIITCRNLFSFGAMLLVNKYYKLLGMRKGMTIAGLLTVSSFLIFAFAKSHAAYCLAGAVMGIAYGFGTMIPIAILIGRWFNAKKGTALGICTALTGLSTIGIPSLIASSIDSRGLKFTFLFEALIVFLLVIICAALLRDSPEKSGMKKYGTDEKDSGRNYGSGLTKTDYAVILPVLLFIGAAMNVSYSHISVLMSGEGVDSKKAALAISVSGVSLMLGKLAYGRISDTLGGKKSNYIFAPVFFAGLVLCCFIKSGLTVLFAAMILFSFGMSYMSVGLSSWCAELSDEKNYPKNIQFFQVGYSAGSLLFSALPGIIADKCGGSYVPAFVMFLILALLLTTGIQFVFIRHERRTKCR